MFSELMIILGLYGTFRFYEYIGYIDEVSLTALMNDESKLKAKLKEWSRFEDLNAQQQKVKSYWSGFFGNPAKNVQASTVLSPEQEQMKQNFISQLQERENEVKLRILEEKDKMTKMAADRETAIMERAKELKAEYEAQYKNENTACGKLGTTANNIKEGGAGSVLTTNPINLLFDSIGCAVEKGKNNLQPHEILAQNHELQANNRMNDCRMRGGMPYCAWVGKGFTNDSSCAGVVTCYKQCPEGFEPDTLGLCKRKG